MATVSASQFSQNLANGILASNDGSCPAPVSLIAPTGTYKVTQDIRPTAPSTPIDALALLNDRCGIISLPFTNNATDSVDVLEWVSNCPREIQPFVACNVDTPLSIDSSAFKSVNDPFPTAGTGNDPRVEFLDCFLDGSQLIGNHITFKAKNPASFDLMSNANVTLFSVNVAGNFDTCKAEVDQNNCSPCIGNSNTFVTDWNTGVFAMGGGAGFYIPVPAGVAGKFDISVVQRGIQQFVDCGAPASSCGNY